MLNHLNSNESFWETSKDFFYPEKLKSKTTLLSEGEISKKMFYVEKGCLRVWFNSNGKEITFQFFSEGQMVSSFESFWTGQPSLYNIETIEDSIIHTIKRSDFQEVLDSYPSTKKDFENYIYKRLGNYVKLFLSRISDKPEQRYKELLKTNPEIIQRIPQHYIASYLGISAVSLSRIRNRR